MSFLDRLAEERRARLAAERMLELKQAELSNAARRLDEQKRQLAQEISRTRAQFATVRDENARVKSDLTHANRKIQIVEQRLWHSVETIQDGFAVFDEKDRLVAANKAFLRPFEGIEEVAPGLPYPRLLQIMTEEGLVDPGDESDADWRARMLERWHSERPEPVVIRLFNDQFIKLIDRRGPGGDMVSLALNITETVRSEARLRAAQRKAEAASRAKSAFLANMSHEIRTPMNGVVGMAELLLASELSDEQRLYAETIRNSGEALLTIINDVLDYSKIESDKIVLRKETFDLEYMLQEIALLLQPRARETGISLFVDYDMFLPTRFIGDPGRLRQVMTNLMGNAVKFTRKGHVIVRVVGVPDGKGRILLHIAVEDTGIGIAQDQIEHIFGEFNQVEDERNRSFEGTGLGLSISRKLTRLMGGDIWVTSVPGVGSCFGVALSLPAQEPITLDLPNLPPGLRSVLVVDPKPVGRTVLARQLGSLGLMTHQVARADDAVSHADVDAVVISSEIDDSGARQTIARLRAAGMSGPCVRLVDGTGNDPVDGCVDTLRPASRRDVLSALARHAPPAPPPSEPDTPAELDVLLAEDNKTNQLVFSKLIADLPIRLRLANNGREAVEEVARKRPDLIFMDISMPQMDGKEATRLIRSRHDPDGTLPIIAVTAHAMTGDREDILAEGLTAYLTKPVRKAQVLEVLKRYCPGFAASGG